MSRIRFEIVPPIERPEQPVFVCGSGAALGDWDAARAFPLRWDGERHVGAIEADTGTTLEFKILRGSWEAEAVDAWGSVPPNARHDVWLDATVHRTVADWKDRYAGRLTRDRVYSRGLAAERELLIWLPPGYVTEPARHFPVIYLNDGANVFDPETSPLSRVDLAADEWARMLAAERVMPESILVGVCHPEGFSEGPRSGRDLDLSPEFSGGAYAQFLADELVPSIDARYRTVARSEARTIGGAGLGALNALHTVFRYPETFGRMFGFSTPLSEAGLDYGDVGTMGPTIAGGLPAGQRISLDYGTKGPDRACDEGHRRFAAGLRERGAEEGRDFRIVRVIDGRHAEGSWRQWIGDAWRFLAS